MSESDAGGAKGCRECVGVLLKLKRGLGVDDAWLENRWKFPQFNVFANKGRCLIFGFWQLTICLVTLYIR